MIKSKPILILDFGSQYTQLIGRRIRELGVYCEIHSFDMTMEDFKLLSPSGIILSGGPASVTKAGKYSAPSFIFDCGLPILGICYGMQIMASQLGGRVDRAGKSEFGYAEIEIVGVSSLFQDIEDRIDTDGTALLDVWMSHGDGVRSLPPGFTTIAKTQNTAIAAMAFEEKSWFGLQFHPEVTHTPQGLRILKRFVLNICKAEQSWTPTHIISEAIANIRAKIGQDKVLLGLSGGVDSSVVASLLHKAIGSQLICVFVDTGLLRHQEQEQVMAMFARHMGVHVIAVNAEERFLSALQGIVDPEEKRKIIGRLFIEIFEEEAQKIEHQTDKIRWLAQGTIYPDVIESAATKTNGASVVIKSHHNVGGLPETMLLSLLEPLRELFKDEVRKIGLELGLPYDMVYRHPFPGPGLGVRVLGEVKKEYLEILRVADAIFIEELHKADLYQRVSQAFAVFLPVKSVAVMGDGRCYDYVICLRAVETIDFMTAHWAELPWDFLGHVSNRIINEVQGVSRVAYDISGKPPSTIEWE